MGTIELNASGIYEISNSVNGNRYIGSAANFVTRWRGHRSDLRLHKHHSQYLQRAWDKYGEAAFTFRKLLICAKSDLLLYEQILLDGFSPEYNVSKSAGTSLGVTHGSSFKEKCRAVHIGKKLTSEHRAAISAAHKGKKKSAEAIAKAAASRTGIKQGPLSEEHRAKISASLTGKKLSALHASNISKAKMGRRFPDMIAVWAAQKAAGDNGRLKPYSKSRSRNA